MDDISQVLSGYWMNRILRQQLRRLQNGLLDMLKENPMKFI